MVSVHWILSVIIIKEERSSREHFVDGKKKRDKEAGGSFHVVFM